MEDDVGKLITPEDRSIETDWVNPPSVSDLKQDYTDAQSDQDEHTSDVDTWLDNLNVTGSAAIEKVKGRSNIVPKLIRKQAEWRYAALSEPFLSTDDLFNTAPVTYEDKQAAVQNGLVLNSQFNNKIKKIDFIDEYVRTAVDEGTSIVRVGWKYEDEIVEVEVNDFTFIPSNDPEYAQTIQRMLKMAQEAPDKLLELPEEMQQALQMSMQAQRPMVPKKIGTHTEEHTKIKANHPTVEICEYDNITIDPSCNGDIDKARFVIYSFETSLSELEEDGRYSNLESINVSSASVLAASDHISDEDTAFRFKDKPRQRIVAYEYWGYWDIDDTGIVKPIAATWVGDVMIRLEDNPFPDKLLPFISVQYLPVRRSLYGEPDGALLEDNQKIVGAITRGMIDIMGRSANGQQGTRKDALDVTNLRKFEAGKDYKFNPDIDPRQAFHMHTYPEIPQSAQYMINMQNLEAESLTGVKAFNQGITGAGLGDTAASVRGALDAASKRELGILRRLAEGVRQIGKKITAMNAVFLSEEEVVRITNEEFVTVRRDDLAGDIDITLSISTAEADEHKAQELAFMLQTLGNSVDPQMTYMLMGEIATLRKMPLLAKQLKEYKPEPNPLEQEKAQLEIELLKAQIAKEYSIVEENKAEAQLDYAKAGSEGVKAQNTKSDTDLKNLDFLEQQEGVTHARDVDRITSQAEAQGEMKVTDNVSKAILGKRRANTSI